MINAAPLKHSMSGHLHEQTELRLYYFRLIYKLTNIKRNNPKILSSNINILFENID